MHPETQQRSFSMFRAATIVSGAAVLSRLLGYARESVLAAQFGATPVTDAYIVAQEVPSTLNIALVGALISVFIPVYQDTLQRQGPDSARRLTNSVLTLSVTVAAVLVGLGVLFADTVASVVVPGFSPDMKALTAGLLRFTLPSLLFFAAGGVLAGLLNANRRFGPPSLTGVPQNLAIIGAAVAAASAADITWVAIAMVVGAGFGMLIQTPWLPGTGFAYRPTVAWKDPALRRLGLMFLPVTLSFGVQQIQVVLDKVFASGLTGGSIAALNFANRVGALPYGMVGIAVTTVLFPALAEHGSAGRTEELRSTIRSGLRTLAFLLVPMVVGTFVFREEIVRLFFERGRFTPDDTALTAFALQFFCLGILFTGWLDLLTRTHYALQDTTTPMFAAMTVVAVNIGLNFLLIGPLKHGGLALGSAMASALGALVLLWRLRVRLGPLGLGQLLRTLGLGLAASGAGAWVGWQAMRYGTGLLGRGTLVQAGLLGAGLGLVVIFHIGAAVLAGTPDAVELRTRVGGLLERLRGKGVKAGG